MLDRILSHLAERKAIIESLSDIMGFCDERAPIVNRLDVKWCVFDNELRLQVDDTPIEEDYYSYTICSRGNMGEELFMGENDGVTYILAYEEYMDSEILMLLNSNRVNG